MALRIVFMGTPEFAVPSLKILIENNYNIVGVITAPDKPKGRGQVMSTTPIKDVAVEHNLRILQPTNLKSPEFISELKSLNADLQIIVAFRMLPEAIWSMPLKGTFNLHASLLPQYRGAAPINWAIINGEKETGITTFFLKHEIDTGNIIFQEKEPIYDTDNAGTLYERLMNKGANLVLKTVQAIEMGEYTLLPQDESLPIKHAPKIFKETCQIDWSKSFEEVNNFIRGLSPYPNAWTVLNNKVFKIRKISKKEATVHLNPGEVYSDNKKMILVKTADGFAAIDELQPEGKKWMNAEEFLRGNKLQ